MSNGRSLQQRARAASSAEFQNWSASPRQLVVYDDLHVSARARSLYPSSPGSTSALQSPINNAHPLASFHKQSLRALANRYKQPSTVYTTLGRHEQRLRQSSHFNR